VSLSDVVNGLFVLLVMITSDRLTVIWFLFSVVLIFLFVLIFKEFSYIILFCFHLFCNVALRAF